MDFLNAQNLKMLFRQNLKVILWLTTGLVTCCVVYLYWMYNKYHPSTDNAYVYADIVQVAPQVTGPISKLYVKEYDEVAKGQALFDIDPATFQVAVDRAESQLALTKQNVEGQKKSIAANQALVEQRQSELKLAQQNYSRVNELVKRKQMSLAEGDKSTRDVKVANSALIEANNNLQQAIAQLGDPNKNNAQIRSAEAELEKAKLNLSYTHVTSPTHGYVVNLSARVGAMVQRGASLFSIVDSSQWWVDANFKETELERVRPGQPAKIIVDIYPDHAFHGYVQNISRGSGAAFSIFPAENATGNWVKVTQRFPVRIYITDPNPNFPLRIGASSTVTVDTTARLSSHGK